MPLLKGFALLEEGQTRLFDEDPEREDRANLLLVVNTKGRDLLWTVLPTYCEVLQERPLRLIMIKRAKTFLILPKETTYFFRVLLHKVQSIRNKDPPSLKKCSFQIDNFSSRQTELDTIKARTLL